MIIITSQERNKMVEENLPLIHFTINTYFTNRKQFYNYDDMFQSGAIGLIKATEKFDVSKNIQFSTYAITIIKFYIQKYINKNVQAETSDSDYINKDTKDEKALSFQSELENRSICVDMLNNSGLNNLEKTIIINHFNIPQKVINRLSNYEECNINVLRKVNKQRVLNNALKKIQLLNRGDKKYE